MSQFEPNFLVRLIFQGSYLVVSFENKFQQKEWKKETQHNAHFSAKPTVSQGPHLAEDLGESWLISVRDWWSNSSVCCLSLCLSPLFSNVRVSLTWHFSTSSVFINHSQCVTHSGMYHTHAAKMSIFDRCRVPSLFLVQCQHPSKIVASSSCFLHAEQI